MLSRRGGERRNALEQAEDAQGVARGLLSQLGHLHIVNKELYAGETKISGSSTVVEETKAQTGFGCTIFLGNIRTATTARAAGRSDVALGTTANEQITQKVLRSGVPFRGITRTIGKNWAIIYSPLRAESEKIIGMLATYRELVDFADDLTALDGVPEALIRRDKNGKIHDANLAACDLLGYGRAELLATNMSQLLAPGRSMPDDLGPTQKHWWRRNDGHIVPVEIADQPVVVGGEQQCLLVIRDYTEQFKAHDLLDTMNQDLLETNESLEERISERTDELRKARDSAMRADLAKSELLAHMSNSLEGPTTAILSRCERLLLQSDANGTASDIEAIRDFTTKIQDIVSDLSNWSRMGSEAERADTASFSLRGLTESLRQSLQPQADQKQVLLSLVLDDDDTVVQADYNKLTQVLSNLLSNGIKYTDEGTVTLEAYPEGQMVVFLIQDTGQGMTPDLLQGLQRTFEQTNHGSTPPIRGTGVGLAMTRHFVGILGGQISCRSTVGIGTRFEIRIPISPEEASRRSEHSTMVD